MRVFTSSTYEAGSRSSTLIELLRRRGEDTPERLAYRLLADAEAEEVSLTYGELLRRAQAVAAHLQTLHATGERALLLYPPGLDYVAAFFGCLFAGVVAVPAYPPRLNRNPGRLEAIAADAGATLALATGRSESKVELLSEHSPSLAKLRWVATDALSTELANEWREHAADGDSTAYLQYTSGSTGAPKGVMISHANVLHNSNYIHRGFEHTPDSISLTWLPHFHDMGLLDGIIQPLFGNFTGLLMSPAAFLQRPYRWLQAISRQRVTHSGGPNFAYDLCARKINADERASLDLSCWRVAYNGAEPVRSETLERFAELFAPCGFRLHVFYPAYGLAEATLKVAGGRADAAPVFADVKADALARNRIVEATVDDADVRRLVGSGSASLETEIAIVNSETRRRCAPDEVGEIWVRSASVAAGYWMRDEETERIFRARLADTGEGAFLRTGDLGFVKEGELFVTGRLKDLIIIRGRNLYPQDIEAAVGACHPALRRGSGAAFSVETNGAERLVILQELEPRQKPDSGEVFARALEVVAEEFESRPSAILLLKAGSIPKTSSGKIQRHVCREKYLADAFDVVAEWHAPLNTEDSENTESAETLRQHAPPGELSNDEAVAEWLRSLVASHSGVAPESIDLRHSLARYGLDSLATLELAHAIETNLNVVVPVSALLSSESIAQLAANIRAHRISATAGADVPAVVSHMRAHEAAEHPLSHGQQALWFLYEVAPESRAYNIVAAMRLSGELDAAALRRSFQSLVDRHASLRTTFSNAPGQPVQRVHERAQAAFRFEDAVGVDETELLERLGAEAHCLFNPETGRLLRVHLFRRSPFEHVLLLVAHHIIADLWSLSVLMRELSEFYRAEIDGTPVSLAPLTLEYTDYVRWQRELLAGAEGARLAAYWKNELAGAPTALEVPADRPRPRVQTFNGASHASRLDRDLTARLKQLGRSHDATLYVTLLAAFQLLLRRYTNQDDFLVGSPTAGRASAHFSNIVGYFVNPVVVRARVAGDPTFAEFLRQVRSTALAAFAHQNYPFDLLVKELQPVRDPSRSPLFQVMFDLQQVHLSRNGMSSAPSHGETGARVPTGALNLEPLPLEQRIAQFDLSLTVTEAGNEVSASFEYNTDLYDASTVRRMLGHFETLLQSIAANPVGRLRDLAFLTEAERRQLLFEFNDNAAGRPGNLCVQHLFQEQAAQMPEAVAVIFNGERLTYGELNASANRLAHYLRSLGVAPEMRVAILLERSLNLIVCVLGVLKAGGAYVPLDPNYPGERISFMLRDAESPILLTQRRLLGDVDASGARVVCFDELQDELMRASALDPAHVMDEENLAYVIFTSGSTGRPKGTTISHANLVNAYLAWEAAYRLRADTSGHLQMASFSFDVFAGDLLRALCSGGRLILCPSELLLAPDELYELMRREGVDSAEFVPAVFRVLLQYVEETGKRLDFLKLLAVGSDSWYAHEHEKASRHCGDQTRLINSYGLTEATIDSTYYEAQIGALHADASMPIGRPFANTQIYLLDSQLQLLPVGIPGELHVGGAGLSRGYLNRPALTAERFIPHPYCDEPGARLYRTGDLARYLPGGTIELLGRIDAQVKIRGFRVEVGEIETALAGHPRVSDVAVVAREDVAGEKRLAAYCVGVDETLTGAELRSYLKERVPEFMLPSAFVMLKAIARTPNGKIDRRSLPSPDASGREGSELFVAARTDAERLLCDIWAGVLRQEQVGVNDNFFELGGDSILSLQVSARARKAGLGLTPRQLFEYPTVAELASVAGATRAVEAELDVPTGDAPLTPIQHWFFAQEFPHPDHWNMALLLGARERLDAALLEKAFAHLVRHHDALRSRFVRQADGWRQFVEEPGGEQRFVRVEDVSALAGSEQQQGAITRVANETQAQLELATGVLLKAVLFETGATQRLLVVVHHLSIDGISWRILLEDLMLVYRRLERGEAVSLPGKTTSFKRWAELLQQHGRSGVVRGELDYWTTLSGERVSPLPLDMPGGGNTEASAQTVSIALDAEETRALLQDLPRTYRTQINDVLLTALALAFARWTERRELLIELEGHGREEIFDGVDLSRTVGWFTSAFPVLLDAGAADTPSAVLNSIKEQLRRIPRGGVGYGLLRYSDDTAVAEAQRRALPAAEVSFNYLGQLDGMLNGSSLFFEVEPGGATRDTQAGRGVLFEINAFVADARLQVDWTYSAELHARATVEKLAAEFASSLRALLLDCLSAREARYTPSDFPLAGVSRQQLDELLAAHPGATDIFPLTPMQQGMLFHTLYAPDEDIYTTQISCTLKGDFNVPAWTRAWQSACERHAILRATFVWENLDQPLHIVRDNASLTISRHDWRGRDASEQEMLWDDLIAAERGRGFDLSVAPLMRLSLAQLSDAVWKFALTHHHMLLDGWSLSLLLREVFDAYMAFARDDDYQAPPARQYRDYIAWRFKQNNAEAETYWREALKGFTAPTSLVVERAPSSRAAAAKEQGAREQRRRLTAETASRLRAFARQHGLTLNTLVQGAWATLLSRYNDRDEVLFGATVSGRPPTLDGAERMIGLFINTLPMRVAVPSQARLAGWLKQLQTEQASLRGYEWSSLVEVQGWSEVGRGAPLFESLLIFENYPVDAALFGEAASLRMSDTRSFDRTNYPLTMVALPGDELTLLAHYDAGRFEDASIERMLGHWETLLLGMTNGAERRVSELPLMPEAESRRMLAGWNDTRQPFPEDVCVHQLFERRAAQTPEQAALVFGAERLTYRELNERANRLANYLRRLGVRPESRVGIMLNRSTEMIVSVLGVLKAGGAYLPLDPSYPRERLRFMLEDAAVEILLTERGITHAHTANDIIVVNLDTDWTEIALESALDTSCGVLPENLAYVIYTSGSTGRPKGVLVAHRSVSNLAAAQIKLFEIDATSRILQFASLSFDASVSELFTALLAGATLYLSKKEALLPGAEFVEMLREQAITTLTLPPSFLLAAVPGDLRALKTVAAAGEACPREAVERWASPSRRFLNAYGPTEITVCASAAECSPEELKPHIGRAIANTEIYILDDRMRPVPAGVYGELYVGGAGLTRGYLNCPDATAAAFVPHPFSGETSARLYRTGDMARYLSNGNIDFAGRVDQQVKIRGFRIEPGEIEAALRQHPNLKEAAVVERESAEGEKRLVAYVATAGQSDSGVMDLRRWLKEKLPDYMIPSGFVVVEQLPHTPNGKIDRLRLPALEALTPEASENFIAPRTPVEEVLAAVWSEVLGIEPGRVGAEDNFFDLGGHSLLATRVLSHVRRLFRRELPLQVVFEATTVAKLARVVVESETQFGQTEKIARVLQKLKSISPDEKQATLARKREERNNA